MDLVDILSRLSTASGETSLVERKPGSVNKADLRREACAFANSVSLGEEAVIFIGLHDKTGAATGVENVDSVQKKIHEALRSDCYPPIDYTTQELPYQGKTVLALVIPFSVRRPHFSGPAFVRVGSQTRVASAEALDELILSRVDKCAEILRQRDKGLVSVRMIDYQLGSNKPMNGHYYAGTECLVRGCSAHFVKLEEPSSGKMYTEPLARVSLGYDDEKQRLMLIVRFAA